MLRLHRYWFRFEGEPLSLPPGIVLGCGVTAFTREDALHLLATHVFRGPIPPILSVTEDIDVSTLDAGHVLPNMHEPASRGVWYPLGYR